MCHITIYQSEFNLISFMFFGKRHILSSTAVAYSLLKLSQLRCSQLLCTSIAKYTIREYLVIYYIPKFVLITFILKLLLLVRLLQEHWKFEPFSAHKDEKGDIYGRGTQDMKCVGIQYLEAIDRMKKEGKSFLRTVHLSFVPGWWSVSLIHEILKISYECQIY